MKVAKTGSLTGCVATAVLSTITAAKAVMPRLDQVDMLSMMIGVLLLIGLTNALMSWLIGVERHFKADPTLPFGRILHNYLA